MKIITTLLLSLIVTGGLNAFITTGTELVSNGSFENGTLNSGTNPGDDYYTSLDDWFEQTEDGLGGSNTNNEAGELDGTNAPEPTDGLYWGNVKSLQDGLGSIFQNLGTWNTGDATDFDLSMNIGSRPENGNPARLYGGFAVELWGGSSNPVENSNDNWDTTNLTLLDNTSYETVDTLGQTVGAEWTAAYSQSFSISGTISDGDQIWLRIRVRDQANDYTGGTNVAGQSLFDEVSVTAVPEPSVYALFGGILALAWVMVRRRRS